MSRNPISTHWIYMSRNTLKFKKKCCDTISKVQLGDIENLIIYFFHNQDTWKMNNLLHQINIKMGGSLKTYILEIFNLN